MAGYFKTAVLMAAMTALFMGAGAMIGGGQGALVAFVIAAGMNLVTFWGSDKAVLRMAGARAVDQRSAPDFVQLVHELADGAGMPRPAVYLIDTDQPNAFATGRNPENAAVAATSGLLRAMNREEIAAVMAHELAHIKNRDTLIMTLTATMAGAISMLANFALLFGGNRDRPGGMIGSLLMMFLAPLAAALVQMAISRSREYEADRLGAEICGNPLWLASALRRIEAMASRIDNPEAERTPGLAHLFIINPLHAHARDKLFSTHPATQNRVAALEAMAGARGPVARPQPMQASAPRPQPGPPGARRPSGPPPVPGAPPTAPSGIPKVKRRRTPWG